MTSPKPPTLRALTRELRELHEAWSHPEAGGEYVELVGPSLDYPGMPWTVEPVGQQIGFPTFGREYIPGDGKPFDAGAAARRLLAAWTMTIKYIAVSGDGYDLGISYYESREQLEADLSRLGRDTRVFEVAAELAVESRTVTTYTLTPATS